MTEKIEHYFVCIGAQKASTTWLARQLARHHDIFVTPVKELHYFDHQAGLTNHLRPDRKRSRYRKYFQRMATQWGQFAHYRKQWNWYRAYMAKPHMAGPQGDRWYVSLFAEREGKTFAGEATPEYAILGEAGLNHIKRLAPDARVIFILRHPVDRAWSHILHLCRRHNKDASQLSEAEIMEMVQEPRFQALSDYAQTLDDLYKVFAPEQIHLEFYEHIHADKAGALARICAFLGAEFRAQDFPDLDKRYNISQRADIQPAVRNALRAHFQAQSEAVHARIDDLPESWKKDFSL